MDDEKENAPGYESQGLFCTIYVRGVIPCATSSAITPGFPALPHKILNSSF